MPNLLFVWFVFGVMWCNLWTLLEQNPAPSRTHPEGRRSHETSQRTTKNDLERPKIHLNPMVFTVFRLRTKFAFFAPIPLSGVFYPKTDFLNSSSGLTPVFFETKANRRGKYEQSSG